MFSVDGETVTVCWMRQGPVVNSTRVTRLTTVVTQHEDVELLPLYAKPRLLVLRMATDIPKAAKILLS